MWILIFLAGFVIGSLTGAWTMLIRCRKERGQIPKKLNKIDVTLILVGITTVIFIAVMIWLYIKTGAVPDSLVAGYFAAVFGEVSICGWIKNIKEKAKKVEEEL